MGDFGAGGAAQAWPAIAATKAAAQILLPQAMTLPLFPWR
jgi:hypothetical protein